MPRVGRRTGSPLYRPPTNPRSAGCAAIEPPFLWILSFGSAKESISPSGAITRLTHRRDSDLIIICFFNQLNAGCVTSDFNFTHLHLGFRTKEAVTELYFEEIFKVISNQCLNTDILLLNNRLRFYSNKLSMTHNTFG